VLAEEVAMSAFNRAPADLEAILYDWHNANRLIKQQADVGFWINQTRSSRRTLVLGAGTGRIAASLAAREIGFVVALDRSLARLHRIDRSSRFARVCGDMRQLPLRQMFDAIVIPYSTFQLLQSETDRLQAVQLAARLLARGGTLHIDVSASFDERPPGAWRVVFTGHCEDLGETVTELEKCSREADALVIHKEFRLPSGELLCAFEERWTYLSSINFDVLLSEVGLQVASIDRGYGEGRSMHRQVVHAVHKTRTVDLTRSIGRGDG
jgi:SAM-dependent methyltransferase